MTRFSTPASLVTANGPGAEKVGDRMNNNDLVRKGTAAVVVGIVICMLCAALPSASAANVNFTFQTAKTYNATMSLSAVQMATDSHGYAHLAYGVLDESGPDDLFYIYYATNRGGTWTTTVVDGPYSNYSMTSIDPSAWIFVDSKDGVHILYNCYIEVGTDSVWGGKYASKAAGASSFTVSGLFSDKNAQLLAAALGPNDTLSVVCEPIIASAKVIVYATKAPGGSFVSSSIPVSTDYGSASLAVASNGTPYLAYNNRTSMQLECLFRTGSTWNKDVVDPHVNTDYFVSIGINSSGLPRVLYGWDSGSFDDQELRYSEYRQGGWTGPAIIQQYDEPVWVVGSLVVVDDVSHMVYRSSTPALVTPMATAFNYTHYSYGGGSNFETQVVDANRSGAAAALAIDSSGAIHVAFVSPNPSSGGDDILYSTTGTPTPISKGSLDIALILGIGAILAIAAIGAIFILRRKK